MTTTLAINLPHALRVSDEQFLQFVQANPDLRLERAATGELTLMAPTGSESGSYNFELGIDLGNWNRQSKLGKAFDSSSGFRLPNGAIRSPDVAWVALERWNALPPDQRQGFAPLCPDFVVELRSPTDDLANLQAKMREYLDNGCKLGWLIDPQRRLVEIYCPGQAVESLPFSATLAGGSVLPGFALDLQSIFSEGE
ncbi:MAG TPA: Uma2 family endonuclease [Nodosilinea sp.]|nr:Uma2 family endonuclease [Nodosilinea sp.]